MNRPQRNHNPTNLRYAKQTEAAGQDEDGFAVFPSDPAGWRAGKAQVDLDQQRGLTIGQFIRKFAPPSENDTEDYLNFVLSHLVIDPKYIKPLEGGGFTLDENTPLALLSDYALVGMMAQREGYFSK